MANFSGRHQQLLRDLKSTVESLLCGRVTNVWFIYGGLSRLHQAVEKIFKHSIKGVSEQVSLLQVYAF